MKFIISIILILISLSIFAVDEISKTPVMVRVDKIKDKLVLSFKNHEGWHTYWKNPGDAGLPITIEFAKLSQKINLEPLEWPYPKKYIEQGNMLAYGYSGEYSIFYKIPETLTGKFQINSKWLVCKNICIPGKIDLEVDLTNDGIVFSPEATFSVDKSTLIKRLNALPVKADFPFNLDLILAKAPTSTKDSPKLNLYYTASDHKITDDIKYLGLLTPFPKQPFNFKRETLAPGKNGNLFARFPIEWDGEYVEPEVPFPTDGKFQNEYTLKFLYANPVNNRFEVVEKTFPDFSLSAAERLDSFFTMISKDFKQIDPLKDVIKKDSDKEQKEKIPLWKYLLFAFIGGLILNIMPCVLPVISIKLFGLILHQGESKKRIFFHNLTYSFGVIATFVVFAAIILGLKGAGETVGWGFQLQSPSFVSIMIIILFVFTLNLFGLFEFRTPGGSKLGNIQTQDGFIGDFLSGVLATILSTPCSAPFLGTALTFAFTSPDSTIILVFIFIGIGLSFPFLITGVFPKLISFFPKPGKWMEDFKKFLGLSLILTTIWLLDVFGALVDTSMPVLKINTILTMLFFSFYMLKNIVKKKLWVVPFFLITFLLMGSLYTTPMSDDTPIHNSHDKMNVGLMWEAWSEKKLDDYRKSGEIVFIDFTAKWCFTCKVNERLVLGTKGFRNLVKENNVKLLLGDWTKRDPIIGKWLADHGYVGVPAYFVLTSKGEFIDLGETITLDKIRKHIEK